MTERPESYLKDLLSHGKVVLRLIDKYKKENGDLPEKVEQTVTKVKDLVNEFSEQVKSGKTLEDLDGLDKKLIAQLDELANQTRNKLFKFAQDLEADDNTDKDINAPVISKHSVGFNNFWQRRLDNLPQSYLKKVWDFYQVKARHTFTICGYETRKDFFLFLLFTIVFGFIFRFFFETGFIAGTVNNLILLLILFPFNAIFARRIFSFFGKKVISQIVFFYLVFNTILQFFLDLFDSQVFSATFAAVYQATVTNNSLYLLLPILLVINLIIMIVLGILVAVLPPKDKEKVIAAVKNNGFGAKATTSTKVESSPKAEEKATRKEEQEISTTSEKQEEAKAKVEDQAQKEQAATDKQETSAAKSENVVSLEKQKPQNEEKVDESTTQEAAKDEQADKSEQAAK
ncbi:hypothetical protein [Psittacicella hinzii]|uniref:Uncharacterized protein n=1 Tax=Psittacicella hinzii TaxID=2028575 RepID=A0A3A1YCB7_9GAMM|nr:hypothetical protein [Psittacicella hinzii]RIY35191.1 hypothetical protein CKF58_06945 [Psittacicella hinzii]